MRLQRSGNLYLDQRPRARMRSLEAASSSQDFLNHLAGDIRESIAPAVVEVSQLPVVHAEKMKHRRVQVVNTHTIHDGLVANLIRLAVTRAAFETGAGHPGHEAIGVM